MLDLNRLLKISPAMGIFGLYRFLIARGPAILPPGPQMGCAVTDFICYTNLWLYFVVGSSDCADWIQYLGLTKVTSCPLPILHNYNATEWHRFIALLDRMIWHNISTVH